MLLFICLIITLETINKQKVNGGIITLFIKYPKNK